VHIRQSLGSKLKVEWSPLLEGPLADQAWETIFGISNDLINKEIVDESDLAGLYPYSLSFGNAGIALFFSYLFEVTQLQRHCIFGYDMLLEATNALAGTRMYADLYKGFAGIGWTYEHLARRLPILDAGFDRSQDIDEALLQWCRRTTCPAELFEGLGGICLYALERSGKGHSADLRNEVLSRLQGSVEWMHSGAAWRLPGRHYDLISTFFKDGPVPDRSCGFYKVGVAHGVSGTLGALAAMYGTNREDTQLRLLLEAVTEWVFSQRLGGEEPHPFPEIVGVEVPMRSSGWCNGGIGICLVLMNVSCLLERFDLYDEAVSIAVREATKSLDYVESHNRYNYTLCHGSAGRAHLLNRMFQLTGAEVFADAARFWLTHTLRLRSPGRGTGGFLVDEPQIRSRKNVNGFLMGAAGLGLALLAAVTKSHPTWDRLLLASFATEAELPLKAVQTS